MQATSARPDLHPIEMPGASFSTSAAGQNMEHSNRLMTNDNTNTTEKATLYCRRHRRTKEVTKEWVSICSYLCPKCYRQLSQEERLRYAPGAKPIKKSSPPPAPRLVEVKPKPVAKPRPSVSKKPLFERRGEFAKSALWMMDHKDLMPRYSISCKKCGQTVPCHLPWFDKSKVLCPSCYSRMSPTEVKEFHEKNGNSSITKPQSKGSYGSSPSPSSSCRSTSSSAATKHEDFVLVSRRYSDESIKAMTVQQLKEAVRHGYISRPRARIEMNRRRRADYYNMMPDIDIVQL